jgi:hypothetical protein
VLVVGLVSSFGNLSTVSFLGETLGSFLILILPNFVV